MKTIEATIPASMLEEIAHLLVEVDTYAMTAAEARRFGRPDGRRDITRGSAHELDGQAAVQVEMVVDDEQVAAIVAAIIGCTRKACPDEGQVLIAAVSEMPRGRAGRRPKLRPPRPARDDPAR